MGKDARGERFMKRPQEPTTIDDALEYLDYTQQQEADRQEPKAVLNIHYSLPSNLIYPS